MWLWVVAVFNRTLPEVIYEINPRRLEPCFTVWEVRLRGNDPDGTDPLNHINNPKIPLKFIAEHGIRIWPPEPTI